MKKMANLFRDRFDQKNKFIKLLKKFLLTVLRKILQIMIRV